LVYNVDLAVEVLNTFLNFKNFREGALPDWLCIKRSGFQSVHADVKTIQSRVHAIEPRVDQAKPRIHAIEPRKDPLLKRTVVWKVSRALFIH